MDFDKIAAFFKIVGFPAGIALWFMWEFRGFLSTSTAQQATMIELLRQLIAIH